MDDVKRDLITCPKCHFTSGDDWMQCNGVCPMSMSPHYLKKTGSSREERDLSMRGAEIEGGDDE